MGWFYRDWSIVQDIIMLTTFVLATGVLVAALVALFRSHRHQEGSHSLAAQDPIAVTTAARSRAASRYDAHEDDLAA